MSKNINSWDRDIVAPLYLRDLSLKDKSFDEHKKFSIVSQKYYANSLFELDPVWRQRFQKYAVRKAKCANYLVFNTFENEFNETIFKLKAANFCRVRYCPTCQFRRAKKNQHLMLGVNDKLFENYPGYRYLFLTLTVPNCDITNLRDTLSEMNKAFKRLTELKRWPGVGWIKSTEVTKGIGNDAHPHFHCLIMVKPEYFNGDNYIKHDNRKKNKDSEWLDLWNQCYRSNNIESLHITAIKDGNEKELKSAIFEVMKYSTKESDLVDNQNWFLELTKQTHHLRFIEKGGVFRDYYKEVKDEPKNLIHVEDDENSGRLFLPDYYRKKSDEVIFTWNKRKKGYVISG